ncbi:putative glucose-6-phosphate 1-epimerase isoform X2 [Tripterygium wilfordii]|uniref:putative glucose-6-phosphate 1-epimerase isoform X2 n=1 Tax=Tripterygium wilfordii TaxID=458696 RepID=UPI0018F8493A|nr:putative glucose-6-phosphate 1-epimerase isoform X2 [Tripterygium wilfordii]
MGSNRSCLGTHKGLLLGLACTEDRLFLGGMNEGRNSYSPAVRQSLSPRKTFEVESPFASHSLEIVGHRSSMVSLGTRFGLLMKIHHSCTLMIPIANLLLTCCLNHPKKTSSAGPIDGDLILISRVRNVNGKPFSFSFAYHTHLSVSDISEVRIEGLETLDYLDSLCQRERFTEQGDAVTFESEIDRVYLNSPSIVAVLDHEKKRTFVIKKEGLPDCVVWNPWEKKSKSMADFGDEEYKQMLCVNGAAIGRPITLKPGEEWTGRLELSVVSSSFCSEQFDLQRQSF